MAEPLHQALSILRRKQVESRTGLRRSTIYQKGSRGPVPRPRTAGCAGSWLGRSGSPGVAALADHNEPRQVGQEVMSTTRPRGGAGGRPPLVIPLQGQAKHSCDEHSAQRWCVVIVSERCHLWGRYGTEAQAADIASKLRRHGFGARVEVDQ